MLSAMKDLNDKRPPNRLADETSPYLLQHAHNPVDWYPWGEEALNRAHEEGKPIFLSIGYSACHWCHVMERESFESEEVAELLKRHFISIKVDREERPDLDEIYMTAVQMLTGSGGWPMTVFLTPDRKPFFGGTYFPPENRYGRVGFKTLLERIAQLWSEKHDDILKSADEITRSIGSHAAAQTPGSDELQARVIDRAVGQLEQSFDPQWGGFGEAPKFPPTAALHLLMRQYARTGGEPLVTMLRHTLDYMARGGLYDQVGGGFHRYSVDEKWLVPHFEKMLYDNALLATAYTEAWQLTHDSFYRDVAVETLDYVLRDMSDEHGAFYSSEDADSEGEEGKFYVWTPETLKDVLGEEEGALACDFWGVTPGGNFEGASILHVPTPAPEFAERKGLSQEDVAAKLTGWKLRLLEARSKRVRPGLDDKVITAWNGLMISAFARAGRAFQRTLYIEAARRAAQFLLSELVLDNTLYRTWRAGRARHPAYLDDHAFLVQGLIDLYEAEGDPDVLDAAEEWAERMLDEFRDAEGGGCYYTSARLHRDVLVRSKPTFDGAEPSGNSVAAHGLLRLAALTTRDDLFRAGDAILRAHAGHMEKMPRGLLNMLAALDFRLGPIQEMVVAGDPSAPNWSTLNQALAETYLPNAVTAYAFPGADYTGHALLSGKRPVEERAAVYVCEDRTCHAPVTAPEALRKALAQRGRGV